MAWNEPGGGNQGDKDKDPWGKRDDQGPPDLDEAFRKLQNNLSEMFGGKGGGRGGSSSGGPVFSKSIFGLAIAAVVAIWGFSGIYTLDQQESGVVLRFGEVQDEVLLPGLHWNPPFVDKVLSTNVTRIRSKTHDSEMLTEDENIVIVKMSVQYVVSDVSKYLLSVRDPDQSLYQATESALRHEVGSSLMNQVLTEGRAELGDRVKQRIQTYMNRYGTGIEVAQVNIDETAPPDAVRAAFDDVIKAREDETRFRNEASAYSNQVIPEARGEAQRLIEESLGYKERVIAQARGEAERFNKLYAEYKLAPVVTRERLYLDTIESVMSSSTKVMVDVEGGNNMLYLPLDKIMEQRSSQSSNTNSSGNITSNPVERVDNSRRPSSRRDR
ncbi:MAG: FtsH protease activity modulator HflK [Pseudomonadales bacterium]|jgi:modulator of FtsH protease HflK|nr:FtsH protease activity modulator HflK [Pseudomonadales bacterium]MDP4640795.1 FtsH protease activity modulator HflK [Pseudomonadales bacterium]MDP4765840.1 FtsH protease activity modulator HflK [Pseudomonadales bacterium]MDP4875044.1 FtsH protease activity modulator HflK [Pseudomonadales bacterium]MDP4912739.1 FtsH protease activity modulator HflK [Pseudomonadales bacterium]